MFHVMVQWPQASASRSSWGRFQSVGGLKKASSKSYDIIFPGTSALGSGHPPTTRYSTLLLISRFVFVISVQHTNPLLRPSLAAGASEDRVQNCCTDFLTASEALGLPSSVVLHVQSLTIQSDWARWSNEPKQLGLEGGASSSQLQLSGTHCRFTFAPYPSVAVSFK